MASKRRRLSALTSGSREDRAGLMEEAEGLMRNVERPGGRKASPSEAAEPAADSVEGFSVEQLRELDDAEVDAILDRVVELVRKLDQAFPGLAAEAAEELLAESEQAGSDQAAAAR